MTASGGGSGSPGGADAARERLRRKAAERAAAGGEVSPAEAARRRSEGALVVAKWEGNFAVFVERAAARDGGAVEGAGDADGPVSGSVGSVSAADVPALAEAAEVAAAERERLGIGSVPPGGRDAPARPARGRGRAPAPAPDDPAAAALAEAQAALLNASGASPIVAAAVAVEWAAAGRRPGAVPDCSPAALAAFLAGSDVPASARAAADARLAAVLADLGWRSGVWPPSDDVAGGEWGAPAGVAWGASAGAPAPRVFALIEGRDGSGAALRLAVSVPGLGLAEVHRHWVGLPAPDRGAHPLAALAAALCFRAKPFAERQLMVTLERRPPRGRDPLVLTRGSGLGSLVSLGVLEAVEVDGEAFATRLLGGVGGAGCRCRVAAPQGSLFPGPRALAAGANPGALVVAAAGARLTGDERSPLRTDLFRLGLLAFALRGLARVSAVQGAKLVGGRVSPANRRWFSRAVGALRGLSFECAPGCWVDLADAERAPDGGALIGPPRWALERGFREVGGWRLTHGLFRRLALSGDRSGHQAAVVERTVAGLEGALLWGSSAGKGKGGRRPVNVVSVRPGGPGPRVFVPRWQLLRLAGEPVGPGTVSEAAKRRYRRRVLGLEAAGLFVGDDERGTAPAGDTVEIVERVTGSRTSPGGVVVRASARFCAAYARGGERRYLPGSLLVGP